MMQEAKDAGLELQVELPTGGWATSTDETVAQVEAVMGLQTRYRIGPIADAQPPT
jgi:hypothetical protein